jgi:hypothetical protein
MRILIISLPRTGSTSLLRDICNSKKLKEVFEPFDGTNRFAYNDGMDNIVVKTIVLFQKPSDVLDYNEWILEFSKKFDEVILLSRKNLIECAESHAYAVFNRKKGFTSEMQYIWEETPNFDKCYSDIIKWDTTLKMISTKLDIPITYYEDIYDLNSDGRLRKGNRSAYTQSLI